MWDILIEESNGNGGDALIVGNDLAVVNSIENQVYFALFGGNRQSTPNASTSTTLPKNAKSYDWWGNSLLMPNNASQQFNSNTQKALDTIALTSQGRVQIQNAVNQDLQFLQSDYTITVLVSIISDDVININITLVGVQTQVVTIQYKNAISSGGDFSPLDFNSDFFT